MKHEQGIDVKLIYAKRHNKGIFGIIYRIACETQQLLSLAPFTIES